MTMSSTIMRCIVTPLSSTIADQLVPWTTGVKGKSKSVIQNFAALHPFDTAQGMLCGRYSEFFIAPFVLFAGDNPKLTGARSAPYENFRNFAPLRETDPKVRKYLTCGYDPR